MAKKRTTKSKIETTAAAQRKTARICEKQGVRNMPALEAAPKTKPSTKLRACLDLLGRRTGATIDELSAATGWQRHSVRGFLSGTVKKKLGLSVSSIKDKNGDRRYRVAKRREAF